MQLRARIQKVLGFWSNTPPGDCSEALLMKTRFKEEQIFPRKKPYSDMVLSTIKHGQRRQQSNDW